MDGMIGGVGGVGGIGGVGMIGGMGGGLGAAAPAMGSAAGASAATQSSASASSPSDVTVNISGASKAALAADAGQPPPTSTVQPSTAIDKTNSVSLTINAPNGISNAAFQDLLGQLGQNEWNNLIADLLLALLLQQMQKK